MVDYNSLYTNKATNAYVRKQRQAAASAAGIKQQVVAYQSFVTRGLIQDVAASATKATAQIIELYVDLFASSITRNRAGRITAIHKEVGEDALRYIQQEYRAKHPPGPFSGYRNDRSDKSGRPQRDAGGRLYRALGDARMFRAAADGLDFIDPTWLDSQARQWYRLHYGAGARAGNTKPATRFEMTMFGTRLPGDIALEGGPSSAFSIPSGFWLGSEGVERWNVGRRGSKDAFYLLDPYGKAKFMSARRSESARRGGEGSLLKLGRTPTVGFAGSRYLDAGVGRVVRTLPAAYAKLIGEWFQEAQTKGGGPFHAQHIKASTPLINKAGALASKNVHLLAQRVRTTR